MRYEEGVWLLEVVAKRVVVMVRHKGVFGSKGCQSLSPKFSLPNVYNEMMSYAPVLGSIYRLGTPLGTKGRIMIG